MRLGDGREPPPQAFPLEQRSVQLGLVAAVGSALTIGLCIVVFGIANVEITEYGLNYSLLTRKVEPVTYPPGRYWIGPLNHFIRFPSVVTTVQFADSEMQRDLAPWESGERELRSRTKDGLDVLIELSFQYQLARDNVYSLYTTFGSFHEYHDTLVRLAIDRLTEAATNFSATEFFTQRTLIGHSMEDQLVGDFEKRLYATIFSFQLRTVGLPPEFEDAIQETEVQKQDVHVAEAEQNSTRVSLETELMQAKRRTKVVANRASGQVESIMLANKADVEQYKQTQQKSADSYATLLSKLDSNRDELLEYVGVRALRDHPSGKTMIGLNFEQPAAAAPGGK